MAKRIDPQLLNRLADEFEPNMQDAFLASVNQVTSRVKITEVEAAIRRGDIEEAVRLIGFDPLDLRPLTREMEGVYEGGGIRTAQAVEKAAPRGAQVIIRFDVRNLRAEQWIAQRSSLLVTDIVNDQREMIRAALRDGLSRGLNPKTVALDLVGRINPKTGNRVGGLIGLTQRQEQWQRNYLNELLSDDPALLRNALTRDLRDRRFDRAVAKAIREGKPIPAATRRKMLAAYRNKSLRYRAETIARNETLAALNEANREAYRQAVESGAIKEDAIKRYAHTAGDERVRDDHVLIPGMNADGVGLNQPFQTPEGAFMTAPFGIQCRCFVETRIDFLAEALN